MANQIWGISDEKTGHVNQLKAVLSVMTIKSEIFTFNNSFLGKFPISLLPLGLSKNNKKRILEYIKNNQNNLPNLLLVIGRRNLSLALFLKKILKTFKPNIKLIFLMPPGILQNKNIDYIFVHKYKIKPDFIYPHNLIPIDFPPSKTNLNLDVHTKSMDLVNILRNKCNINLKDAKKPYIGVIIGGKAKGVTWNTKVSSLLCNALYNFLKINKGTLFVVNSRRTGNKLSMYVKNNLPKNSYFFDYNNDICNPYIDLITKCDVLIVTGESTSMMSDCVTLNQGAKVLVFDKPSFKGKRFINFREFLYKNNFATSLKNGCVNIKKLNPPPKINNSTYFIADFINSLYN